MPLSIEICLEGNTFKADGDFALDDQFTKALSQFINAISDKPNRVQALADQMAEQQTKLEQTVDAHKGT